MFRKLLGANDVDVTVLTNLITTRPCFAASADATRGIPLNPLMLPDEAYKRVCDGEVVDDINFLPRNLLVELQERHAFGTEVSVTEIAISEAIPHCFKGYHQCRQPFEL
jgi:hypothetical protein